MLSGPAKIDVNGIRREPDGARGAIPGSHPARSHKERTFVRGLPTCEAVSVRAYLSACVSSQAGLAHSNGRLPMYASTNLAALSGPTRSSFGATIASNAHICTSPCQKMVRSSRYHSESRSHLLSEPIKRLPKRPPPDVSQSPLVILDFHPPCLTQPVTWCPDGLRVSILLNNPGIIHIG